MLKKDKCIKRANRIYGGNFYSSMEFRRDTPQVGLSVSYKINNYHQQQKRDNSMNDMDFGGEF